MASKSSYSEGEKGAEVEDQLDTLDKLVDRLRVLYEQYFLGMAKQAPSYLHTDAERKVRDLTQLQIRNTAQRYRFATITQKFGAYNMYWRRTLREIDQGRYVRDLSRIKRRAQQAGEEIPAEILAAMPKRMREMVERDRAAAVARSGAKRPGHSEPPPVDEPAVVRDQHGPFALDLGAHDDDLLDAIAREAEDAVDRALARVKADTNPPLGAGPSVAGAGRQGSSEPPSRRAPASSPPPYAIPAAPARTSRMPTVGGVPPPPVPGKTPPPIPGSAPAPVGPRARSSSRSTVAPRHQRPDADTIPTPMGDIHPDFAPGGPQHHVRPATEMATPPPPPRVPPSATAPRRAPQRPAVEPPPGMTEPEARALYAKFLKARQLVGESNDGMSYDKLVRTLRQQGARIMDQYQAKGVEFGVVIKDNKVILKAKPKA